MRAVFVLFGLFVVHRLLIQVYPPYRERMRAFDQKMTWITLSWLHIWSLTLSMLFSFAETGACI